MRVQLAVFRPTPGSFTSPSMVFGTPVFETIFASAIMFFAFVLYMPTGRISRSTVGSHAFASLSAVGYFEKSASHALAVFASRVRAESAVATTVWNGVASATVALGLP